MTQHFTQSQIERSNMLLMLIKVSSAVLSIFFFANWLQGLYLFSFSNFINLSLLLISGYYYKKTKNINTAAVIALLSYYATFITAIFEGGIENTSFIWTFIFPPIAIYLLGQRLGIIHTALMLGTIALTYIISHAAGITTHYTPLFFIIIAFGVIVESALITFFETTRQKYASLIEEQKEKLKAIFDSQSNISFVSDVDTIQSANRAFFDFFGFPDLASFYRNHNCICDFFETVPGNPIFLQNSGWLQTVLDHPLTPYKVKMKGLYFAIQIRKINFPGKEEYVVVLNDISSLVDYQKRLEKDVAQAVEKIEIQNTHLLEQSKKAMLGELISFISHQLKQPLTAISATIQGTKEAFLHNELNESSMRDNEQIVIKNIDFMADSIDSLRNFYRPNKIMEEFLVGKSIEKVLYLINKSLRQHNIETEMHLPQSEVWLTNYENEFQQVLINLITNAKDAFAERKIQNPKIDITVIKLEKVLQINVSDNAGGIPEEHLSKIFENFFTTKGKIGTGIGLYMSKMIIEESMHGHLSVCNSENGAQFTIELPLN